MKWWIIASTFSLTLGGIEHWGKIVAFCRAEEARAVTDPETALGRDTCRYVLNVPPDIDKPATPAFDTTIVRSAGCKKHLLFFPAWGTGTTYEITNEVISQMVHFSIEAKEKQLLDITEFPPGDYGIRLLACGNGGHFTLRIKGVIRR